MSYGRAGERRDVMTEKEWRACKDPSILLAHIGRKGRDRKLRLYACACCRRVWKYAGDSRLCALLEAAESVAEGTATDRDRERAHRLGEELTRTDDKSRECLAWELWGALGHRTVVLRNATNTGISAAAAVGHAAEHRSKFNS